MIGDGFTLFDTTIGCCGIAWGARGVIGVQLPEARESATRARLQKRFPAARETQPPPDVQRALERITALLRGETSDLSAVALDMDGVPAFHRRVYEVARRVAGELGLALDEVTTGGASEASFAAALGVPTLDGLGADGDGAHAEDEHVLLSSLPERAALAAGLIPRLAGVERGA